jgi:hypothetical protein
MILEVIIESICSGASLRSLTFDLLERLLCWLPQVPRIGGSFDTLAGEEVQTRIIDEIMNCSTWCWSSVIPLASLFKDLQLSNDTAHKLGLKVFSYAGLNFFKLSF